MRKTILLFMALAGLLMNIALPARSQQVERETYFPYPIVPDSITTLDARCNFLLDNFWKFCDLKKAFSSRQKMRQAFADYLSFMPYASSEKVHESIAKFTKSLEKQPNDLLFIVEEAEAQTIGDSCQFYSEEIYLDFARALVNNRRIDKTAKLRYEQQIKQLGSTQPGMTAPDFDYKDRSGQIRHFNGDSAEVVVIYFSDPDCSDCRLAKTKLDANIQTTRLIDKGMVKILCISPVDYSEEWAESVAGYPEQWIVGAAPDIDLVYHIDGYPSFYLLDKEHKIYGKNYSVDDLLDVMARLDQRIR